MTGKRKRPILLALRLIFSIFLAFSLLCPLSAEGGAKGLSLKEIDELVKAMNYDEALLELSRYIENHPDELDFAQKRIDKIMNARDTYSNLANKLLDVIENEPDNLEKTLRVIAELESIERHPSEEHLAFIRQAKITAEFKYFQSQFARIIESGESEVQKQNYVRSVALIREGFYMYRDDFYDENPRSVTNSVTDIEKSIADAAEKYSGLQGRLNSTFNAFMQALRNADYNASNQTFSDFQREMQNFASVRNQLVRSGAALERTFEGLKARNPELTDASYLPFMSHFTLGMASRPDTGILGAMDAQWNNMVERAKPLVYQAMLSKTDAWTRDFNESNLMTVRMDPSSGRLTELSNFAGLGLRVNSLYGLLQNKEGASIGDVCPEYTESMNYAVNLVPGTRSSVENLEAFKADRIAEAQVVLPDNPLEALRNQSPYASSLLSYISRYEAYRQNAQRNLSFSWFTSYNDRFSEEKTVKTEKTYVPEARKDAGTARLNELLDFEKHNAAYRLINGYALQEGEKSVLLCWKRVSSYYAAAGNSMNSGYTNLYEYSNVLYRGIDSGTPETLNPQKLRPGRYPSECIEQVNQIEAGIQGDINLLRAAQSVLSRTEGLNADFSEENSSINNAISTLNSLVQEGQTLAAQARSETLLARSSRTRADEMYSQAERLYRRGDYSGARDNIQKARELYNESLSHQESVTLRASSDQNLADLGQQVNDAENRLIVAEVRQLKTQAKNEYYAGNFESSESLLNRAKNRWSITNVDEDEEITNLMLLVENALSMKTGREIKPTAPLYPEMSQILSIAHQYFDEGSSLISMGKKDEAVQILEEARRKLQELQTVYPLNQEASLLTLRIQELIDPSAFNEMFRQRINAAKQNYKIASTQQSAYSDLLDLYKIRPDYPGLKDLIYNVEIEIGIRPKPVDKSGIARSQNLTQQASRLVDTANGNESVLRTALAQLDEAISLNPNNERAIILKDRIQISIGGKASVVLSSADEERYQQAIQLLNRNDVVGAYTLVEQLLQKPECRRSTKILDLQKRVNALM